MKFKFMAAMCIAVLLINFIGCGQEKIESDSTIKGGLIKSVDYYRQFDEGYVDFDYDMLSVSKKGKTVNLMEEDLVDLTYGVKMTFKTIMHNKPTRITYYNGGLECQVVYYDYPNLKSIEYYDSYYSNIYGDWDGNATYSKSITEYYENGQMKSKLEYDVKHDWRVDEQLGKYDFLYDKQSFADGLLIDIESYLPGTKWRFYSDYYVVNPLIEQGKLEYYDDAVAQDYYRHSIKFDLSDKKVDIVTSGSEDVWQSEYVINENGTYIDAFEDVMDNRREVLRFFICDGMLYRVAISEGNAVSHYFAYEELQLDQDPHICIITEEYYDEK